MLCYVMLNLTNPDLHIIRVTPSENAREPRFQADDVDFSGRTRLTRASAFARHMVQSSAATIAAASSDPIGLASTPEYTSVHQAQVQGTIPDRFQRINNYTVHKKSQVAVTAPWATFFFL